MVLALRHEERISQLVVVDTAPVYARFSEDFKTYIDAMKEIEELGVTSRRQADEVMRDYVSVCVNPRPNNNHLIHNSLTLPQKLYIKNAQDQTLRQFLLINLKREQSNERYRFQIPLGILKDSLETLGGFPFYSAHQAFHKKTLFVVGKRSNYVPPKVNNEFSLTFYSFSLLWIFILKIFFRFVLP